VTLKGSVTEWQKEEVIRLLRSGRTQAAIAVELGISQGYVSKLKKRWMEATEVNTR
jgi:DNA-binding CsgD family transcriptional regulator